MCGIFGCFGKPDHHIVTDLAVEASRRGPHSCGWASKHGVEHRADCLENHIMEIPTDDWMVGHSRLATSGNLSSYLDLHNNQPLVNESVVVAHNGNVYDYRDIYAEYGYMPYSENDSEALIALFIHEPTWQDRFLRIAEVSPMAVILKADDSLYIVRAGHPLYWLRHDEALYVCSRRFHADCELVPEGVTECWEWA